MFSFSIFDINVYIPYEPHNFLKDLNYDGYMRLCLKGKQKEIENVFT